MKPVYRAQSVTDRLSLLLMMLALGMALFYRPGGALAAVSEEVVLPLGVIEDGRFSERLTAKLREALRITGAATADDRALHSNERKCGEKTCLLDIAQRHKASVLMSAVVEKHDSTLRYVRVWVYDTRTLQSSDERSVGEEDQLEQLIKEMAVKLIEAYRAPPASGEPARRLTTDDASAGGTTTQFGQSPPADAVAPIRPDVAEAAVTNTEIKKTDNLKRRTVSPLRKGLAATFGVLAVSSLVAAITLTALSGVSRDDCRFVFLRSTCEPDYRPLYAPGYALSGILTAATILTLTVRR